MAATEKAVIIMVHGAFHRPIHYEPVLRALRDKGFTVLAPELPTTGLDPSLTYTDDVELINQVLEPVFNEGKEVVVVAHSFGALPASHCIEGESVTERKECGLKGGIRHYINVCGMSYAEKGKDFMGKHNEFAAQDYHRVEDGLVHLLDSAKPVFYSDLTTEQIEELWPSVVKTHSLKDFNSFPKFVDKEIKIPKTYVFCENDVCLPIEYQAFFVGHGCYEDVIRIPSGHFPFLKMPEKMIEIICEVTERS